MVLPIVFLVLLTVYLVVGRGIVNELISGTLLSKFSGKISGTIIGILMLVFCAFTWNGVMFYADPGYNYQVRMITGKVDAYNSPGWKNKLFGTYVPWKKAMSVSNTATTNPEEATSASLPPYQIRMLDRVDGYVEQTTRFRLPDDIETFLRLAEEYRSPENLLRTELIPTVQQVITANSSLMGAEDYFNGKRNDFQMDFVTQMREGMFMVERKEVRSKTQHRQKGSADASKGGKQDDFGDQQQTRFVVEKIKNTDGTYKINKHNYHNFGITVVDAKITNFEPNKGFKKRMADQQQASADRSIAREQRIQEEEQKQLVVVRGDREIAEEQAKVKKNQIKRTTEAETAKALALIEANKLLEQAEVQKRTALVNLDRDTTIAESKKVLADADKYEREARIAGDNALQQRLDAEVAIQTVWAKAYANRKVPAQVFTSGGASDTSVGGDMETTRFMQLLTADAAKRLSYDRSLNDK